jgi:glycerophosphoryl diester phosphodiesterase
MTPSSYSPGTFAKSSVIVGSAKPRPPIFVVRPRHVFGAIALVLALIILYLCGYEPAYDGTLVIRTPRPLLLAGRVIGDHPSDKSLYAVDRALEAGMDGVDVDAQLAPDGELAIYLGGIYLGRFEDFVRSVKERSLVLVELKTDGIEQRAIDIIRRYDAHLSVVLSSSDPVVLYRVKQLDPLVRTAFIFTDSQDAETAPWVLRQEFVRRAVRKFVRFDMLSINYQVDESVIDRLIAKGWPVFIWTPNTELEIRQAIARRPYGVIANQPILAR